MNIGILIGIALWAIIPGKMAKKKERSFWGYYLLSFVVSPLISMIIVAKQPDLSWDKESFDSKFIQEKEKRLKEEKLLANGGWRCKCGHVNPVCDGVCVCGVKKHELIKKKKFFELEIKNENPPYVLPELTEKEQEILGKWADVFWENCLNVLKNSSGDLKQDKIKGMKLICDYIMAWESYFSGNSLFYNTKVTPGQLRYNYHTSYGRCYDGGCYSDESYEQYLEIQIVTAEIKKLDSNYIRLFENFKYRTQLPLTDCYVYAPDSSNIWIEAPFGLACGLHIKLC